MNQRIGFPQFSPSACCFRRPPEPRRSPTGPGLRKLSSPEGKVVIYQPQPEKLEGDILSARAAIAIELKDSKEPVFGAIWAEARLETDRSNRTATVVDITVTKYALSRGETRKGKKKIKALDREGSSEVGLLSSTWTGS